MLRSGARVVADTAHSLIPYLAAEGVRAEGNPGRVAEEAADHLLHLASRGTVVWLVGDDGDPELGAALGRRLEAGRAGIELEVLLR